MDPTSTTALPNARIQPILLNLLHQASAAQIEGADNMPAPPAYHTIVNPNVPTPAFRNTYAEEEEEDEEEGGEDDEIYEVTINALTQIRGHGNVFSTAQMDSVRVAGLIASVLHGGNVVDALSQSASPSPGSTAASPIPPPARATPHAQPGLSSTPDVRKYAKINITVNCGATIIGDRNIVGPGLGEIARQRQIAQRNQLVLAAQQRRQQRQQQQQLAAQKAAQEAIAQHHGIPQHTEGGAQGPTPPMSRSSSVQSDVPGGIGEKRKAEEDVEDVVKKRR